METTLTKEAVTAFLTETLETEKDITLTADNANDALTSLGLDSFGLLEVIFAIEDQYNVDFPKQYDHIQTVQDVINVTFDLATEAQQATSAA